MELIPHNPNIDFVGKRRFFIVASIVINTLILLGIALFGFNWGVDFAGGSEIEVQFEQQISATDVRKAMEHAELGEISVQTIGAEEEHSFLVRIGRVSLMTDELAKGAEEALRAELKEEFQSLHFNVEYGDKLDLRVHHAVEGARVSKALETVKIKVNKINEVPGGFTVYTAGISDLVRKMLDDAEATGAPKAEIRRVEFVGPQVGEQLRNEGFFSIFFAAAAILLYIAFRFDTRFAPGAIIAMFHDVLMVLGFFLVSRREFNLTSVAALLTIIGYSVNDTIVVYDRIRENMGKMKGLDLHRLINVALNETLARTILTSFATALSLVGLLIFGVGQIWDFSVAMLVGIVTGTYSTIFIAAPVTIWLEETFAKKGSALPVSKAG